MQNVVEKPSGSKNSGTLTRRLLFHEFLQVNRAEILARSRSKLAARHAPTPTEAELAHGPPLFLDQLVTIFRTARGERGAGHHGMGESAALHGAELLRIGLTVGHVVQDYSSVCQSVTELAHERLTDISPEDLQTFNRCHDDAIAQAVSGYERQRDEAIDRTGAAHLAALAHEMRNLLTVSMLTFDALTRGKVGGQGSTGALLGRTLRRMRVVVDHTLAEVRLGVGTPRPERVMIAELMEEIEIVATIEAVNRDIRLSVDLGAYDVAVTGDQQSLASAVSSLVQNAFKFTRPQGHIRICARAELDRVLIEVQDECGGLPPGIAEMLSQPDHQRGTDQPGPGLGLAVCLRGVRTNGGELKAVDNPGKGCTFTIDLPRAT